MHYDRQARKSPIVEMDPHQRVMLRTSPSPQDVEEVNSEEPSEMTLQDAESPTDTEQAWRTVRSYFGMEIFIEFDIGTPGQTLRVLIDSGSDWFWVTTERCRLCGGIKRFDHKASTSYEKVGTQDVSLYYGSGKATGDHIRETVCLSMTHSC